MRLFFILFIFLIGPSAVAQKEKRDNYPWITIRDIKACRSDTFRIRAKVIDRYNCPPCPKGAICKPCIGDHITVADADIKSKQTERIFMNNPDDFTREAVYVFTLRLRNKAHPDDGTDLVAFETLKK